MDNFYFNGIGQQVISYYTDYRTLEDGCVVALLSGAKRPSAGDDFVGVCLKADLLYPRCSRIQIGGIATVKYSGETAPTGGKYNYLVSDGTGGVKVAETSKKPRYVIEVDKTNCTAKIIL